MSEKRFYWLKLKNDYFDSPKIKKLRKIAGGDTYTIIYLKMQLLSINNEGVIKYEGIEDTFEEELALKLNEEVDDVKVTLMFLQNQSLIDTNDNECLFLEACNNIGSEGQSAERKRRFDEKKRERALQSNSEVTNLLSLNSLSISNSNIYKEIIDYLNSKLGSNYRSSTPKTQTLIKARLNEKFTIDDFKKVIDNKVDEWKNTEMAQYLRPETLFGTKFESYLNQLPITITIKNNAQNFAGRNYSKEEIESIFANVPNIEDYDL